MIAAMAAFVTNDMFLKLAATNLPPFQTLFLRGVAACLWSIPLVFLTKTSGSLKYIFHPRVVLRNFIEFIGITCFVLAIARMSIAGLTALIQTAPLFMIAAAALFFKEQVRPLKWVLVFVGFAGAMFVAQPGGEQFSAYSLLGFVTAVVIAARDYVGKSVPLEVPGPMLTVGAVILVTVFSGGLTFVFEDWVVPHLVDLVFLSVAGLLIMLGHWGVFVAYRHGDVSTIAPFFYTSMIWAFLFGIFVFGTIPNALAILGMVLILLSGISIALIERRAGRLAALVKD